MKYTVRAGTTDRGIVTTVVLQDEYRANNLKLSKDSVVIDIGAQTGIFSVHVSKRAGKVYMYEPVPENYNMILKNISNNRLKNLIPHNMAVSDKKGKLKIYLSSHNTGGHSAFGKGEKFIETKTTSLKDIFNDNQIEAELSTGVSPVVA